MRPASILAVGLALALTLSACTSGSATTDGDEPAPPTVETEVPRDAEPATGPVARAACSMPRRELVRIANGYHPDRSGDVLFAPREPNTMGVWYSHSGPWDYLQHVPLLFLGPGHVPEGRTVDREVTLADLAPTIARFLRFEFETPDGVALEEAVLGDAARPPKLVLTVVWDAGGRNVLAEHPDDWPNLRRLVERGTWFENASVGSSPTITAAVHATIGTGTFPRRHGRVDHNFVLDGTFVRPEYTATRDLLRPALADLYGRATDPRPRIGVVAHDSWHLGMIGHGAAFEGGTKDLGVLRDRGKWGIKKHDAENFRTLRAVNEVRVPADLVGAVDREDGLLDGAWHGDAAILEGIAYAAEQTEVVKEVVRREGFGTGPHTDLLFVNYKQIDKVGHNQTMNSPQMGRILRTVDEGLGELVRSLDREVGRGEWVLAVTADHGATPTDEASGGFSIGEGRLENRIEAAFGGEGREVVRTLRQTQLWLDREQLEANGHTVEDVARFILRSTKADHVDDPSELSPDERDERLFSAAIPGEMLERLPCLLERD